MNALPPAARMYRAVLDRDPSFEGLFFFGVKTTGVFCRPSCPARSPNEQNVEFFASADAAARAGFRACKKCRPTELAPVDESALGLSPGKAAQLRLLGQSAMALRATAPVTQQQSLPPHAATDRSRSPVTDVQLSHGWDSPSGFREAFTRVFGVPPSRSFEAEPLFAHVVSTPLGAAALVASERGLRLLAFEDQKGLAHHVRKLGPVVPGTNEHIEAAERWLTAYFRAEPLPSVALDPVGTPFQQKVWAQLSRIGLGETKSYAEVAVSLGSAGSVRAVARANALNPISLIVPCHRVVGADGSLRGYAGGLWRKRWLLARERAARGSR